MENHLNEQEVTVITGMRRTGKTTALKYLLEKTTHETNCTSIWKGWNIAAFLPETVSSEIQADLEFLGYDFAKNGVIAIDEVQLIPEVVSFIKYYHDNFL
ncbi:MAG: AAA family ATPase [Lewinellaceae bacterium]|nr:AAA family ATPase [Lewinellaceae bacterium]